MTLWSADPTRAKRAILRMLSEIARLEDIFSLYRPGSELSRLNRNRKIDAPSRDIVLVLDQARQIAEVSRGAFDPTIQPLWTLHAATATPDQKQIDAALALVDYAAITASRRTIRYDRAGMSASLNGIAQGYITDRVTELLGNEGFENAVIELGETRALGHAPDGSPFSIGLVNPDAPNRTMDQLALSDAALSVSGGYGHRFRDGIGHHIFDPHAGTSANRLLQVAVIAPKAALADALSTAIYVAGEQAAPAILSTAVNATAILTRPDGTNLYL
jgi:thiamine biosynthesis lipoprotein